MLMQNLNNFYHQLFNLIMQIFYFERSNQKFRPLLRLSRIQENMFVIDHKFKNPMALYTEMPHDSHVTSHMIQKSNDGILR